ncbi:MAG: YdeI/OmpD-associated family protein [Archangium sp.]|nr:YdeI/OmpD-associated family protein [Archangium sp.]
MPDITETVEIAKREQWRAWLAKHHHTKREIWLVADLRERGSGPSYLDVVEEALCFGWIDGLAKKFDDLRQAQRFTPRRPNSNWTELNKERVRRLIREGLMTEAGLAVAPDLTLRPVEIAPDIARALEQRGAMAFFTACPEAYQRIRLGYVEEQRGNASAFTTRLSNLVKQSAAGVMFGNWDDSELRRTPTSARKRS